MQNAQTFIEQKLAQMSKFSAKYEATPEIETITKLICSKKFRKYAVTAEYGAHIRSVVEKCIARNQPIPFVWVFGGYKLWSLEEAPEADWAELFSLMYFVEWLKPVVAIYKPGVWFDFFSDDVIVPMMNNIDPEDTKAYIKSFASPLSFIKPYLPSGFSFTLHRVVDQYNSYEEFRKELDKNIKELTLKRQQEPKPLSPAKIAAIDLNVKPDKEQQKDPHWRDKVQIIHDAYSLSSKRRPYYRNPDKIMVINTPIPGALAVGTTKTSVVKFWVGMGALKEANNFFREYILSPKQIAKIKIRTENISISGLDGNNFQRIKIFN